MAFKSLQQIAPRNRKSPQKGIFSSLGRTCAAKIKHLRGAKSKLFPTVSALAEIRYLAHKIFPLCLLLLATQLTTLCSGALATPTDSEAWLVLGSKVPLDAAKRYQLYLEVQPRLGNDFQRMSTTQIRSSVTYLFGPRWELAIGHAWTPILYDADYHRIYIDEHRAWQGISFTHKALGVTLQHRIRQEQRFIESASDVSHRSRYQLRGSIPFSANGEFGVTVFDEVMTHLNSVHQGPTSGYDRNRVFIGPFWQVAGTRYEFGYLGEHAKRFGADERWVNAVLCSAVRSF